MPSSEHRTVRLTCHPDTRSAAVRAIGAHVTKMPGGVLALTYVFGADLDRLRVPAPRPPGFAEELWRHTCCEVFVACTGLPAYHEFNLAPSGEWAAYAFTRYRDGAPLADESLDPRVTTRVSPGRLELDALIRLERLSPMYAKARFLFALAAVIEDAEGSLSYWALAHPPGAPDFHHPVGFALELE